MEQQNRKNNRFDKNNSREHSHSYNRNSSREKKSLKSLSITFPTETINNNGLHPLSLLKKKKVNKFDQSLEKQYSQEDKEIGSKQWKYQIFM